MKTLVFIRKLGAEADASIYLSFSVLQSPRGKRARWLDESGPLEGDLGSTK